MICFVDAHRDRFEVEPICRVLQATPSTYYAARQRPPSARQVWDEALKVKIRHVHAAHFGVYGARKLRSRQVGIAGDGSLRGGAWQAQADDDAR